MSKIRFSNPAKLAPPPGYSYVVEASGGRTVYFAGQLGVDEHNKFVGPDGGDFRAQCVKAFENLTAAIKAAGASWSDVVKINNYLIDIEKNIGIFREVRDTFVNTKLPPASTTIGVPALARPGGLFEIEAIAVVGKSKKKDKKKKKS